MKIGFFADGPWGTNTLIKLIKDSKFEITFCVPRIDTTDGHLIETCKQHNIPILNKQRINSKEFLQNIKNFDFDIFVSMSFNQIFKTELIELPRLKTINCHAGLLPFYRGRNVLNWVLINGETHYGITVHYVDDGIDTGDIIEQRKYPIQDDDDYGSLLDKAYTECAEVLYQSLDKIRLGTQTVTKQKDIHPVGMYCGRRKLGDEIINWNQKSQNIHNFIRGICKPGPMATTFINGNLVKINKSSLVQNAINYINIPGQVIGSSNGILTVKTLDNVLDITEFYCDRLIKVGDRLTDE